MRFFPGTAKAESPLFIVFLLPGITAKPLIKLTPQLEQYGYGTGYQAYGKPDGMDGYRPFTASDYENGMVWLTCLPGDTHAVEEFVTGYLSKRIGDLKKRLEEISRN